MRTSGSSWSRDRVGSHSALLAPLVTICAVLAALALLAAPAWAATPYNKVGSFGEGQLTRPYGVALDQESGDVYVTSLESGFEADLNTDRFDAEGNLLSSFGTFAASEPPRGGSGVAVDPVNGDVDVVDALNQKIQVWDPSGSGTLLSEFSVEGSGNPNFQDLTTVQIATDSQGNIYFPNQPANEVQVFGPTGGAPLGGVPATIIGSGEHAFSEPRAVATDSAGNVYVVDYGNGRVEKFNSAGVFQSVLDSGGAVSVAVDLSSNDVFVGEPKGGSGYHIVEYEPTGAMIEEFGLGQIGSGHETETLDNLAVNEKTHTVYVTEREHQDVLIFRQVTLPAVTTGPATGVTAAGATLNGEINPMGNEVSCHFEYGTSTTYEHSVPCQPELVGEGSKSKPESVTISGLEANTEYHFRLVATTAGKAIDGADETFTTSQAPPVVLASSVLASDVTQSDVVFNAIINPQHLDTHYYFNYGPQPFDDSGGCVPSGTVPYATAPVAPLDLAGPYSTPEELAGLPAELDLASVSVVLHPGMESRALEPNTAYHFQVVAENAAVPGTSCEPEATFITLPPDPAASTGAASGITQTAASLAGAVTPGSTGPNSDTTWRFQYGTDTSYTGGSVPVTPGDAGMGTGAVPVSTALKGLAPNTTYHYRLLASNTNADPAADPAAAPQVADGAGHTLTTLPPEPLAGQPSGLSETGVTLNGHVNPGGHDLHYSFQYGTSTAYAQSTPLADAGEGAVLTPVNVSLAGLTPGVTYHYRLVAAGAGGDSYSLDATFTLYPPAPPPGSNPFSPGQSTPTPFATLPLLSTPTFPSVPTETAPSPPKPLTNAQKLAKALKACQKDKSKTKRVTCEKQAHHKYGTKTKAKKSAKRGGRS